MDMLPFNALTDYQFKHMDKPLILPDDILGLVRELSMPRFKYFREYKSVLTLMGCPGVNWQRLRMALLTNPEKVGPCLIEYEIALSAWVQVRPPDHERLTPAARAKLERRTITYLALGKMLGYGE